MPGAGVQVGTMFAQEGQRENGLIFHNGRYLTTDAYNRALADETRQAQEAATIAKLQATSARQPTTTGGVINYGPNGVNGTGTGSGSGSGGSASTQPPVSLSSVASAYDNNLARPIPPAPVYQAPAQTPYTDTTEQDALTFARAKDKVGLNTRASLDALRNEFAGRNMLGSRMEGAKIAQTINQGQGDLANTITGQAVQKTGRDAATADRNYQGALEGSRLKYQGETDARGQDIGDAENRRQSILALARLAPGGLIY